MKINIPKLTPQNQDFTEKKQFYDFSDANAEVEDGEIPISAVDGLSDDLDSKVDDIEKGALNGVATLNGSGKVPFDQIPPEALDRINHTGTQLSSTISDFDSSVTSSTHAGRSDNPHSVTQSQVGLGNVNNTSDADKPISISTQSALDGKVSIAGTSFVVSVFYNGWGSFSETDAHKCVLYKQGNIVNMRGVIALGVLGVVFNIPAGYRSISHHRWHALNSISNTTGSNLSSLFINSATGDFSVVYNPVSDFIYINHTWTTFP